MSNYINNLLDPIFCNILSFWFALYAHVRIDLRVQACMHVDRQAGR